MGRGVAPGLRPDGGSAGVVDLSGVTDAELVQVAARSWVPRWR
ncbi:MAG TPA: hypothetical protein VIZ60_02590 [Rubrobacter sp.]